MAHTKHKIQTADGGYMMDNFEEGKTHKIHPEKMGGEVPTVKEYYPSFSLKLKDIPEAKDWEVGKTHKLALEVKQTSLSKREGEEGDVRFDILKIKAI